MLAVMGTSMLPPLWGWLFQESGTVFIELTWTLRRNSRLDLSAVGEEQVLEYASLVAE